MVNVFILLAILAGQNEPEVKVSIRTIPANPVADRKALFTVEAVVTDAQGKPIADVSVRFGAHGYAQAPDGTIVGRYSDMKLNVDYQTLLPAGGLLDGKVITNTLEAKTNDKGVAQVRYKPPPWAEYMAAVPTRVTAEYKKVASLDIQFRKPQQ